MLFQFCHLCFFPKPEMTVTQTGASKISAVKFTLGKYNFLGNCHFQIIFFCDSAGFSCFGNVASFPVYFHGEGFALLLHLNSREEYI